MPNSVAPFLILVNNPHDMSRIRERGRSGVGHLIVVFGIWKLTLLTLAAFCPGPGYDTSALILIDPSVDRHQNFSGLSRHDRLTLNLFRWDAVYLVQAAERGKIHEQEWAFSLAYSWLLRFVGRCKRRPSPRCDLGLISQQT